MLDDEQIRENLTGERQGETVQPRDYDRLNEQAVCVFDTMADGLWHTLDSLSIFTGYSVASISARLRDFRKPQFGSHEVERRHIGNGLHEYRLIVNYTPRDENNPWKRPETRKDLEARLKRIAHRLRHIAATVPHNEIDHELRIMASEIEGRVA